MKIVPFGDDRSRKIVSEKPAPLPQSYSTEFQFLVFKLLEKDPSRRPDADAVLQYSAVSSRVHLIKKYWTHVFSWRELRVARERK